MAGRTDCVEKTLIILKPDAVHRRLVGRITARFEQRGLRIAAMQMRTLSEELVRKHYSQHEGKSFYEPLVRYMSNAPVVLMVLEGMSAVRVVRDMLGATFGGESASGTIRGDFCLSNRFNLVHASDSSESAEREIALFFSPEAILDYEPCDSGFVYDLSGPEPV